MTSKERVLKTVSQQEPDRVPIGEWGIDHDHVSRILGRHTYWRNRKDTTLALWEGRRDEVVEGLKRDYVDLIEALDYDVIPVERVPPKGLQFEDPPQQTGEGRWENSRGDVYVYSASNDSIAQIAPHAPGKESLTDAEIEAFRESHLNMDESEFELVDHIAEKYAETKAVVLRGIYPEGLVLGIFGGDQAHRLMMTAMAPDEVKKMIEPVIEVAARMLERAVSRDVLIGMPGHDFGTKNGLLMSPGSLRDLFVPILRGINAEITRLGMIPFFHCCGNCWEIMDDYVDVGYKGYQSVQASAGMDWSTLKAQYGDKLTLWAGVQCETLIEGSQADVENEVSCALETLMPGGGFIFGSTNSVQFGANTDNYLKALEIVREQGKY